MLTIPIKLNGFVLIAINTVKILACIPGLMEIIANKKGRCYPAPMLSNKNMVEKNPTFYLNYSVALFIMARAACTYSALHIFAIIIYMRFYTF